MAAFFDPDSRYNRYRAGYAPAQKLYGYFLWRLRDAQPARTEALPRPGSLPATPPTLSAPAMMATAYKADTTQPRVLAFRVHGDNVERVAVRSPLCSVSPSDKFDSGTRLDLSVGGLTAKNARCRLLFIHAAGFERLRQEPALAGLDDETLAQAIIHDDCLCNSLPIVKVVSALADLDGWVDKLGVIEYPPIEIPQGSMPLDEKTTIVVVVDEGSARDGSAG